MAEDVRRRGVPLELAVAALVVAAVIPLSRLLRGGGLADAALSALVLSLALAWGWRRLRLPPTLSVGLSILAMIWFAAGVFATETLWGPFPTLGSLHRLADVIADGNRDVINEIAPVVLTDGIRLFVTAGVWVTATMVDLAVIRARSPLLGITFAIPMFVLPGTLLESNQRVLEMLLFLGAGALLLFLDERSRTVGWGAVLGPSRPGWRAAPAVRVAILSIAVAIVAMPLLPGYGAEPALRGIGGGGDRVTFNPLVAIKPTLDRTPQRMLFSVRSDRVAYYRLASLDTFDGDVWYERPRPAEFRLEGPVVPISPAAGPALRQRFSIDALAGSWLPAAYEPVEVRGIDRVAMQTDSRTLLYDRSLERGMVYEVTSRPPLVTSGLLDGSVEYPNEIERYLELPDRVRGEIGPIARRIARGESTPFGRARAIQNHLRGFTYDENVAAGHGFSTLVEFLTVTQRGYCEQFAGSMAVLARSLGIPARVAIGFAGGTSSGDRTYVVTTEFAHAWVEVFFPQAGWVAFEPTPRAGVARVPEYALPEAVEPSPSVDQPDPAESDPTSAASPRPAEEDPFDGTGGGTGDAIVPGWSKPLIGLGVVLVAVFALIVGRGLLLGRRISHAPSTREAVRARYVDFLAWCAAAGVGRRLGETPAEHASRVGASVPAAAQPLDRLAELVGYALWAQPNGLDHTEVDRAAQAARDAITATLSPGDRALAILGWGRWRAQD